MAHSGLEMHNTANGLRTRFRQVAADTGGELLQLDWIAPPGWTAGPKHVHRAQEERFEVLGGRARSHVDGREALHGPGDVIVAPPGAVHTVANAGDEELHLLVEFRPALRSEDVLETLAALAVQGRTRRDGVPRNLLDLALIVHDFEEELYLASPPLAVQRALFGPLAWLARRLGRRPVERYPERAVVPA